MALTPEQRERALTRGLGVAPGESRRIELDAALADELTAVEVDGTIVAFSRRIDLTEPAPIEKLADRRIPVDPSDLNAVARVQADPEACQSCGAPFQADLCADCAEERWAGVITPAELRA